MVLAEALRARLLAALRPWLAADPAELRVDHPGLFFFFARARAVARGLQLDVDALNASFGAGQSPSWPATFDRATAAEVELAASPWAAPAVDAVVRGVDVALTLREPAPRKQRQDYKEWVSEEKKRVLASLDPQGEMLHEMIEGVVNSLEDKLASVFSTVLLSCGRVRFDDVTIQVQYLDDSHVFVLRTTDLRFGPEPGFRSTLFRGLVGSLVPSRKRNKLSVECAEIEFLMKENDSVDCSASFTGVSASVRLDNLHLSAFGIHVPKARWEISPKFAPSLMVMLDIASQKEDYAVRNGRELWKAAAQKLDNSVMRRRFSLRKAVSCATFWRSYVQAYVLLLTLVGYPSDKIVARNCGGVSRNKKLLDTIRHQLETVVDLEDKIPVEAIARARCAARSKLIVSQQLKKPESSKAVLVSFSLKILLPFLYLWSFIVFIWRSVWAMMGPRNKASYTYIFPGSTYDVDMELHVSVHLGELSVTLLPVSDCFTDTKRSDRRNTQIELPSVHLVIKSSCLLYSAGCTTQSFFLVLGELKTYLSSFSKLVQADSSNSPRSSSFGTAEFTKDTESRIILWCDSASMSPFSRQQAEGSFYYNNDDLSTTLIKSSMDELWSNWMIISNVYNESGVIHHEKPSVIFEFKSVLTDPYRSISGYQQCRFTIGRLNLDLDYLCASSTYLLYRRFMHHKQPKELTERSADFSNSCNTYLDSTSGLVDKLRSSNHRIKVAMLDVIPEKTLHIVALIAGPSIRLFFDKYNMLQNSKDVYKPLLSQMNSRSCIVFSLAYVECALWPASLSSTPPRANSNTKESHKTFVSAKEPQEHHELQIESSAKNVYPGHVMLDACFIFAGLTLLIDNLEANQQSNICGPLSCSFLISASRNYSYSFFGVRNVISTNLEGRIVGFLAFFCMDELFMVCQLIESMHLEALKSDPGNFKYSGDFIGRLASFYKKDMKGSTMQLVEHIAQEDTVDPHVELGVEMQLDLKSADIIFSVSRGGLLINPAVFFNSFVNYISSSPVFEGIATQELLDVLALGVGFCIKSSSVKLLFNGGCTDLLVSLSGIQCVIFENQSQMSTYNDILQHGYISSGLLHSKNQLIISECVFHITVGSNINLTDKKLQHESRSRHKSASLGNWCSVKIEFTEVFVGDYRIHSYLSELKQHSKHKISLLIHDDLQVVKCKIQGGMIFLETISLAKLVLCYKVYLWLLVDLSLRATSNLVKDKVAPTSAGGDYITNRYTKRGATTVPLGVNVQSEESQLSVIKCLDIELTWLSLTLVIVDKSGTHQGLNFEVDVSLQQMNLGMEFLFEVKRLSISTVSSIRKNFCEQLRDVPGPRFRSSKSVDLSPQSEIQEYLPFVEAENMRSYDQEAPSSSSSALGSLTGNTSLDFSSHENQILKHFSAYLKIQRKKLDGHSGSEHLCGDWSGSGSLSGLEVAMSLSNVEMISSLLAPVYGITSSGSTQKKIQSGGTSHQAQLNPMDYTIPDGAIVAIRDLNQQMYVSVKNIGSTYQVVGAYHYSLAGECALFKVKHHKSWRSNAQCISLLSLCAMNNEGKELALSFSQGSDFVEISSDVDKPGSIWSTLPFRVDSFDDDSDDGKPYKVIPRSSYHLVNKKNNYGIAFVDGLLEFVKKPGNPFKVQVFDESLFSDASRLNVNQMNLDNNTYLDVDNDVPFSARDRLASGASSQHVIINVDKIVFTITHEVSDTDNVFPLVQTCISDIRVVTQIFPSKIRILSSFKVSAQYFIARRNLWEELISPIASYTFFRFRVFTPDPVTNYGKTAIRFFFQLKQVDIFINELSFDILLYLVGKLDLMGPYAVRGSAIFPNSCKIENGSRLALVCHFEDNGDAIIPGQQTTSVFLRHLAFDDNISHDQNVVSICLLKEGVFSTIPISISLHESGIFAWRTRVSPVKGRLISFSSTFVEDP